MSDEEQHIAAARLRDEQRAAELGDYTPVKQVLEMAAEVERLKAENERMSAGIALLPCECSVRSCEQSAQMLVDLPDRYAPYCADHAKRLLEMLDN